MDQVVITIARQYGSGGRTIGEELAKKLGISYYDKDIIRMASEESGIHGLQWKVPSLHSAQQEVPWFRSRSPHG